MPKSDESLYAIIELFIKIAHYFVNLIIAVFNGEEISLPDIDLGDLDLGDLDLGGLLTK